MKYFAIVKDGEVIRTGSTPDNSIQAQAHNSGETAFEIARHVLPIRCRFEGGRVVIVEDK